MASLSFNSYHRNLARISMVTMLDDHQQAMVPRKLSIVGPCLTHEQWVAAHAERRRIAAEYHQVQQHA